LALADGEQVLQAAERNQRPDAGFESVGRWIDSEHELGEKNQRKQAEQPKRQYGYGLWRQFDGDKRRHFGIRLPWRAQVAWANGRSGLSNQELDHTLPVAVSTAIADARHFDISEGDLMVFSRSSWSVEVGPHSITRIVTGMRLEPKTLSLPEYFRQSSAIRCSSAVGKSNALPGCASRSIRQRMVKGTPL
jgi:hypothetical protein